MSAGFDPYQPVIPGTTRQPPSARTFNGLLKAGQAYSRSKFGDLATNPGGSPVDPSLTCLVRNKTGGALPAFSVLAQGAAILDPATVPYDVQAQPAFDAAAISVVTAPFVITQEPLGVDAVGQAVVSGLALVDVNITSLAHTRAVPTAGVTNQLASAASGGVLLWWTPGLTGVQKCLVMLGSSSGGALPYFQVAGSGSWTLSAGEPGISRVVATQTIGASPDYQPTGTYQFQFECAVNVIMTTAGTVPSAPGFYLGIQVNGALISSDVLQLTTVVGTGTFWMVGTMIRYATVAPGDVVTGVLEYSGGNRVGTAIVTSAKLGGIRL